jgi:hypothetical protein
MNVRRRQFSHKRERGEITLARLIYLISFYLKVSVEKDSLDILLHQSISIGISGDISQMNQKMAGDHLSAGCGVSTRGEKESAPMACLEFFTMIISLKLITDQTLYPPLDLNTCESSPSPRL